MENLFALLAENDKYHGFVIDRMGKKALAENVRTQFNSEVCFTAPTFELAREEALLYIHSHGWTKGKSFFGVQNIKAFVLCQFQDGELVSNSIITD